MKIYTPKENVVDNYHGVEVADPYRWLENTDSSDTQQWINEQNNQTKQYLESYPKKEAIKDKLTKLTNYPKFTAPKKEGEFYYFHKNDGLQNQFVFYRSKYIDGTDMEVIIDPNELSKDGTAAITNIEFNQHGTKIAYAISYNGSDWQEVKIKNLITLEDYPEVLKWCKFTGIAWTEDDQGFFYNRYPDQDDPSTHNSNYYNKVYWHKLGSTQDSDKLIYEDKENKELAFVPKVSDDNRFLILTVNNGTEPKTNIYYHEFKSKNFFTALFKERKDYYTFLGNDGDIFYLYTNNEAPKGRVIAIDVNNPEKENWKEIISEQDDAISFVKIINNQFIISFLHNAYNKLSLFDMEGNIEKQLSLPPYISILNVTGKRTDSEMFLSYTSYLHPTRIEKYNFQKGQLDFVLLNSDDMEDDDKYETNQIFYTSKDGTKIPMFLTHKKGLKLTGEHPVLLYGYGGYNISLTPSFSPSHKLWLDSGGIYAVANIRGGGEFGEEWHLDGILEKKQNVFDDFIKAAEWLIDNKYTNSKRLAIMGGSNGGLLVAACIIQRPELFGAGISLVPVTDMLRFHHFTVGRFWTTEFGNAELNPNHFQFMYKYSPLHNVQEDSKYPPTLITTADTDDRVVPLHAMKFAATLQAAQIGENPILLRVEREAGHGLGKPTYKVIEEQTDIYTFLIKQFKMSI